MKKWDYLQLELTLIRCIFKRQWMFHLWYKADMLHFTHLWRTPVSDTQVRQCLCRAVLMNPSLRGKRACISCALAMHNWNKGKMSSSVLMKKEELQVYSAILEWRQPSFCIPPLPTQESVLQKPPRQNTTQHNKNRLCTSLIFPLMLSRQLTVRVRALAEEQMNTAHQKIRDELFIYCP